MVHTGAFVVCREFNRRAQAGTVQDELAADERREFPLHLRQYIHDGGLRTHPGRNGCDLGRGHQQPPVHVRAAHPDAQRDHLELLGYPAAAVGPALEGGVRERPRDDGLGAPGGAVHDVLDAGRRQRHLGTAVRRDADARRAGRRVPEGDRAAAGGPGGPGAGAGQQPERVRDGRRAAGRRPPAQPRPRAAALAVLVHQRRHHPEPEIPGPALGRRESRRDEEGRRPRQACDRRERADHTPRRGLEVDREEPRFARRCPRCLCARGHRATAAVARVGGDGKSLLKTDGWMVSCGWPLGLFREVGNLRFLGLCVCVCVCVWESSY